MIVAFLLSACGHKTDVRMPEEKDISTQSLGDIMPPAHNRG